MVQVSVVIPTFKHRDFVIATLNSVYAQTFTDYEVIVVNDGSPDDTANALKPLADTGRIRYIEQSNQGQAVARNRGLAEAQGEFIAFLDDDDLWPPDKLAWQVKLLTEFSDTVLVYGDATVVNTDFSSAEPSYFEQNQSNEAELPSGSVHADLLVRNWITSPGQVMIRTSAIREINGFDETIWGADDHDLYIRLAEKGQFLHRERRALYYRLHANNASKDIQRMYLNGKLIRDKHIGRIPNLNNYKIWFANYKFCRESLLAQMLPSIRSLLDNGDKRGARKLWLIALRIPPKLSSSRYMFYLFRQLW